MRSRNINAIALAALTAMTLPAVADAQTPRAGRGPDGARMGAPVEHIIGQREALGLTDAQVTELRRIQTQLEEQNRPLLAQLETAREKMRAGRPAPTPEQREQMQQRRGQMRDSMRHEGAMTPEQREQMRARMQAMTPEQRAQMRAQMQARRDSAQPRPFAAQLPEELRTVMEQVRTNHHNAMQQVQATLTAEQRQKLQELRPAHRMQGARRGAGAERLRMQPRIPRGAR